MHSTGKVLQFKVAKAFEHLPLTPSGIPDEALAHYEQYDTQLFGLRTWLRVGGKRVGYTIDDDEYGFGVYTAVGDLLDVVADKDAAETMFARWYAKRGKANGGEALGPTADEAPIAGEALGPDRSQIETFVQTLFKHATAGNWISLRVFVEGRADLKPKIAPIRLNGNFGSLIDQAYRVAELAAHDHEKLVFCPPIATFTNNKHAKEIDLAEGPVLSIECDKAALVAQAKLEAVLGPATLVVASGGEWTNPETGEIEPKLHVHYRLKAPTRNKDEHRMLKEARRLAAMLVGADRSSVPIVHPIRWSGSLHRKGTPKLCHIITCNPDAEIDLAWALTRLREAVEAEGLGAEIISFKPRGLGATGVMTSPTNPNNLHTPCIEAVIAALAIIPNDDLEWDEWNYVGLAIWGATGGSSEGGEVFAAWSAKSKKKDDPAATEARWEHYHTSPPDRIGYGTLVWLARKVQPDWDPPPGGTTGSIFDIETPPAAEDLDFINAGRDDWDVEPRGWLLGNVFCREFVSSLLGDGAVGKTALRYAQYLSLATGKSLTGEHVFVRSRVLLISLEDGLKELRRRIKAACLHHGIEQHELDDWLYYVALGAKDGKLMVLDQRGRPTTGTLGSRLEHAVIKLRGDLLALDPFVKTHGVDENSNSAIDDVVQILTDMTVKYYIAVDIPHHVSKGPADPGNADRGRGASAMKDAARLVYTLTQMTVEEAKALGVDEAERRFLRRMDGGKVNIAPPAVDATWFRLVGVPLGNPNEIYPNGDIIQTVKPWTPPDIWRDMSIQITHKILDAIEAGLPNGDRYSDAAAARGRAAWRVIVDYCPNKTEGQAVQIIAKWIKSGLLVRRDYLNKARQPAKGLFVDNSRRPA